MQKTCLVGAPINHSGMGTHGYFWTKALRSHLANKGVSFILNTAGNVHRSEWEKSTLSAEDEALRASVLQGQSEIPMPDIAIGLFPPQFMEMAPGKFRINYFVFEGSRVARDHLEHMKGLDAVAVPSAWGKAMLEKSAAEQNIALPPVLVWPEGVDANTYFPDELQAQGKVSGPLHDESIAFTFCNIGKMETRKGMGVLLAAFENLVKGHPEKPLRLLAHWFNPWRADWKEASIAEIEKSGFTRRQDIPGLPLCRFTHRDHAASCVDLITAPLLTTEDVMSVYRASNAAVFPFFGEGWCLPLIEALAVGLPTIASAYSGPTEYLRDGQYLPLVEGKMMPARDDHFFANGDFGEWKETSSEELNRQMEAMLSMRSDLRLAMAKKASDFVRSEYSWSRSAERAFASLPIQ